MKIENMKKIFFHCDEWCYTDTLQNTDIQIVRNKGNCKIRNFRDKINDQTLWLQNHGDKVPHQEQRTCSELSRVSPSGKFYTKTC